MAGILWVDIEDLFEYARKNRRPSGIQRLAYEIYLTLHAKYGDTGLVRFVRHNPLRQSFCEVAWADIEALFRALTSSPAEILNPLPRGIVPHSSTRKVVRKLVQRVPTEVRVPLTEALVAQQAALKAWRQCLGEIRRVLGRWTSKHPSAAGLQPTQADDSFDRLAGPGDVLLVLGAPWWHASYAELVAKWREQRGLRCALLVYDLIPLVRPEWVDRGLVRLFRAWYDSTLPQCDHVFAISRATAADVQAYAQRRGIQLPSVLTIPLGSGFSGDAVGVAPHRSERLPPVGSYALIVSTIEARKNHALLFRLWRRLLEELPWEQVPNLVFAGRIGWLVDDLLQQIANTDQLNGKLLILQNPTDLELQALYAGCLFTLFPSLYEGWGLPVTESLAFGKPCFIADRTSLPEAGGTLARRFDPDNLHDAYQKVVQVLRDPDDLARWEARVRREFRPVPWSATVVALLSGLGHSLASPHGVVGEDQGFRKGLGEIIPDRGDIGRAWIGISSPTEPSERSTGEMPSGFANSDKGSLARGRRSNELNRSVALSVPREEMC